MGLLPANISRISAGDSFDSKNVGHLSEKELQQLRGGNEIAMIFQEPMSSLNPSLKWFSGTGNFVATHKLVKSN
jgi:peptide/nickel transport system ATP-binding protein